MGTTVRLLLAFAMVGLVALPAQAHMIGIRGGTLSTNLCGGDLLGSWESLSPDEDDLVAGEESILNDCGVVITSLDIQLSFDGGESLSHLSEPVFISPDSIFDSFQIFSTEAGSVLRLFSSIGNSISSTCFEGPCPEGTHPADFVFFVLPHDDDPVGSFKIAAINEDPAVVPEPATLLLLGTGLVGGVLKRRRRH